MAVPDTMTGSSADADGSTQEPDAPDHPATGYRLELVRYENRPDRCTVSPSGVSDETLVTTWLSVDSDVVVDLKAIR